MSGYPGYVGYIDLQFGQRVRAERTRQRLSQEDVVALLSDRHGIRWMQSTVAKMEAGSRPTRLGEAIAVSAVLGVDLDDLIRDNPGDQYDNIRRSARHRELLAVRRHIDQRINDLAIDDVGSLAEAD